MSEISIPKESDVASIETFEILHDPLGLILWLRPGLEAFDGNDGLGFRCDNTALGDARHRASPATLENDNPQARLPLKDISKRSDEDAAFRRGHHRSGGSGNGEKEQGAEQEACHMHIERVWIVRQACRVVDD